MATWLFLTLALATAQGLWGAENGEAGSRSRLDRNLYRGGDATLRAFAPVSAATRHSIVKLNVDGATVALATVVDATGLVVTKASELKPGKLTAWLATDREVTAEVVATDEDLDLALVRVKARGLKPVRWSETEPVVGQWAITPGIISTPHAVGIVSAFPRRIRAQRVFIGVQFESGGTIPRIEQLMAGLGAEKAGLKPGDLIVAINGAAVRNREDVVECLNDRKAGQSIKVRVKRSEEEFEADIRLMVPPAERSEPRGSAMTGQTSARAAGFEKVIEHDTVLQPWLCGGPLVDIDGRALGLNIARAGRVSTYALPARLVQQSLEKLQGKPPGQEGH